MEMIIDGTCSTREQMIATIEHIVIISRRDNFILLIFPTKSLADVAREKS